jgi:hypothetical protein
MPPPMTDAQLIDAMNRLSPFPLQPGAILGG